MITFIIIAAIVFFLLIGVYIAGVSGAEGLGIAVIAFGWPLVLLFMFFALIYDLGTR